MKKKHAGKTEKWVMAAAMFFGGIAFLAGCVGQTDVPIVSEKTESYQESLEEKEIEETGEPGTGKEGESGTQAGTIREQANVPETYRVSIEGEDVTVTADVKVGVPDVDRVCLKDVEFSPYTDEELDRVEEIIGEELGIGEEPGNSQSAGESGGPENPESVSHIYYVSPELVYTLDLTAGDSEKMPAVWLSVKDISDGTGGNGDPDDLSGCPLSEAEMGQLQAELETKGKQLLEKLGLEDFFLESARWRQLSVSENYSWTLSGQYGVRLYYGRKIGDMPLVNSGRGSGSLEPRSQYVELLYREDKTLLAVKNIGRERIGDNTSEYAGFLLPFSSVSQIFEQCMKTLKVDWDKEGQGSDRGPVLIEGYEDKKPRVYVTVTDVDLAYCLKYDEQNEKGKLVPVWAFYGTAEKGYQNPDGSKAGIPGKTINGGTKMLLLAVGGEDGTVYGGITELGVAE